MPSVVLLKLHNIKKLIKEGFRIQATISGERWKNATCYPHGVHLQTGALHRAQVDKTLIMLCDMQAGRQGALQ